MRFELCVVDEGVRSTRTTVDGRRPARIVSSSKSKSRGLTRRGLVGPRNVMRQAGRCLS